MKKLNPKFAKTPTQGRKCTAVISLRNSLFRIPARRAPFFAGQTRDDCPICSPAFLAAGVWSEIYRTFWRKSKITVAKKLEALRPADRGTRGGDIPGPRRRLQPRPLQGQQILKPALEVIPNSPADARFGLVEEFELVALAVEVLAADAQVRTAGIFAPHPTELHDNVAAVVDFFSQVRVQRQKRSAAQAGVASLRPIESELEFKRFRAAIGGGHANFAVQAELRREEIAGAEHNAVANKVDAIGVRIHVQQILIAQVGADVVVAGFELPLAFAVGDRNAKAVVAADERSAFGQRIESRKNGAFQIDFPAFRPIGIVVAVAPNAGASAERDIPRGACHAVLIPKRRHARLFGAGHVRLIDERLRQHLRVPLVAIAIRLATDARRSGRRRRIPTGMSSVGIEGGEL